MCLRSSHYLWCALVYFLYTAVYYSTVKSTMIYCSVLWSLDVWVVNDSFLLWAVLLEIARLLVHKCKSFSRSLFPNFSLFMGQRKYWYLLSHPWVRKANSLRPVVHPRGTLPRMMYVSVELEECWGMEISNGQTNDKLFF